MRCLIVILVFDLLAVSWLLAQSEKPPLIPLEENGMTSLAVPMPAHPEGDTAIVTVLYKRYNQQFKADLWLTKVTVIPTVAGANVATDPVPAKFEEIESVKVQFVKVLSEEKWDKKEIAGWKRKAE